MASYYDVIEGLKILAKYEEKGEKAQIGGAGHDILFGGLSSDVEVSEEHAKRLKEFGWHKDSETDSWARFV